MDANRRPTAKIATKVTDWFKPVTNSEQNAGQNLKRDSNFNLFDASKQSVGGSQAKQRRMSASGSNDRSDDPTHENDAKIQNMADDDKAAAQLSIAETYADYKPAKLLFGIQHPDPVVETSTLSSIEPNDITYQLSIPKQVIDDGFLSALQLESIVYASQAHEKKLPDGTRAGFLIGDGAGVGKGRTVAGIILENDLNGRKKSIWISVSNDLKFDVERDLKDVGAPNIDVLALNKHEYGKIDSKCDGVIFCTYQTLISTSSSSETKRKYNSRLKQLVDWCGSGFDGVIVFDECHKAKNFIQCDKSKSTQTGQAVLDLQTKLPSARVVYASATGASEPRNMAYMVRLGLWGPGTPFSDFPKFLQTVEKRGVGAMEIVAMDMKLRGMYIARQLSFKGATFKVDEVVISEEFKEVYNDSVKLWVEAKDKFEQASELLFDNKHLKSTMWGQFWGAHQRFFKYMCIASKVSYAVQVARQAVKDGKCAVIGLQSTGEAQTLDTSEENDGELDNFVPTLKAVFKNLVEKYFPAPNRDIVDGTAKQATKRPKSDSNSNGRSLRASTTNRQVKYCHDLDEFDSETEMQGDSQDDGGDENFIFGKSGIKTMQDKVLKEVKKQLTGTPLSSDPSMMAMCKRACEMRDVLFKKVDDLGDRLPSNTLDQLIDELGGPADVAEMTGRKGRVVKVASTGEVKYENRCQADSTEEMVNIKEKEQFMDGDKLYAIISEAASNGISLQSDRRAKNQRRRVHITLELPWSADRAIQQFGRTHRSNQVNAPEYIFLISNLAGERRFASSVSKRLESLGALTHGDRRATETRNLSQFNVENKYGLDALKTVCEKIFKINNVRVKGDETPEAKEQREKLVQLNEALKGVGMEGSVKDITIPKFLNRILGLPVDLQNYLFDYFMETLDAVTEVAKRKGKYDMGIMDLGNTDDAEIIESRRFMRKHATGVAPIDVTTVAIGGKDDNVETKRRRHTVLSGSIFAYWDQIERFYKKAHGAESTAKIRMIRLKMTDGSKIVGVLLPDRSIDEVINDLRNEQFKRS